MFGVLPTLEITEIVLFIGNFASNNTIIKIGGYVGVLTAIVAWYASAAGVINGKTQRAVVWVGGPLLQRPLLEGRPGSAVPCTQ